MLLPKHHLFLGSKNFSIYGDRLRLCKFESGSQQRSCSMENSYSIYKYTHNFCITEVVTRHTQYIHCICLVQGACTRKWYVLAVPIVLHLLQHTCIFFWRPTWFSPLHSIITSSQRKTSILSCRIPPHCLEITMLCECLKQII